MLLYSDHNNEVSKEGHLAPISQMGETEAQRRGMTCPKSHSWQEAEPRSSGASVPPSPLPTRPEVLWPALPQERRQDLNLGGKCASQ